ncbi:MAG: glycosyltransferase family A protein [Bacilli bacterium]
MKYSFIIAMYNAELYIEDCIKSILNQTEKNFEIIIVDDGSKDNSYNIVKKYLDNNIVKCIRQTNKGCGGARNTAIENSKGEYIIIVDADDTVEPDLIKNLSKVDADIIKYKVRCIEEFPNDRLSLIEFNNVSGIDAMVLFANTGNIWATPWGSAIKREIFIDNNLFFDPKKYHEDFGLMPKIYANSKSVTSIDYLGYNYIKRPNSITTNTSKHQELKRLRDFMHFYYSNINYLDEIENISPEKKEILYNYFVKRIKIKINNTLIGITTKDLGEYNYEEYGYSKRKSQAL